ncbi:hypothetical protein TNIN_472861 [Trichonephila inaurata madagascariensis]|nr:hypothetical protein TNIN_472861 [Trichonephila inaurata madagascariensis]
MHFHGKESSETPDTSQPGCSAAKRVEIPLGPRCKINSAERIYTKPSGAQIYTLQPETDLEDLEPKPGPLMSTDDDEEYLTDLVHRQPNFFTQAELNDFV